MLRWSEQPLPHATTPTLAEGSPSAILREVPKVASGLRIPCAESQGGQRLKVNVEGATNPQPVAFDRDSIRSQDEAYQDSDANLNRERQFWYVITSGRCHAVVLHSGPQCLKSRCWQLRPIADPARSSFSTSAGLTPAGQGLMFCAPEGMLSLPP